MSPTTSIPQRHALASSPPSPLLPNVRSVTLTSGGNDIGFVPVTACFEDLDDARAGQVQVQAGIAVRAVRKAVECEQEHEGAVDAFGVEDL
jgi:hypothetical protein